MKENPIKHIHRVCMIFKGGEKFGSKLFVCIRIEFNRYLISDA